MSLLDAWRYRIRALLHPERHARDLRREMDFHLELEAAQRAHDAHGALSDRDAWLAARKRFGNPTYLGEESRQMTALEWLDTVNRDIRFAARGFRRTPGFTAAVVLTLALGIGANSAIFSALHALLLRPLPFPEPDQLMEVNLTQPGAGQQQPTEDHGWSYPKFVLLREGQHVFEQVGLYHHDEVTVGGDGGAAARVEGETVGGRYFETLRVRPILGRSFLAAELDRAGAPAAVVMSESLWQRRFNADPSVLGRTLDIDGKPHTVVGVMPSSFTGLTGHAQVWMPIATDHPEMVSQVWCLCYSIVARRTPAVSVAQAQAAVKTLGTSIDAATPFGGGGGHQRWGAVARPLDARRVDPIIRRSLLVLAGAVALVLVITCANVANLLLVRAARREREIAVRLAIGASRQRLVRQLLTDSLFFAVVGALAAVGVAAAGVQILQQLDAARSLRLQHLSALGIVNVTQIQVNPATLLFTGALAVVTGILFGLTPALQATRPSLVDGLKGGRPRGAIWRAHTVPGRGVLPIVEIGLAVVLLVGSGLMLRSLAKLIAVDPGFDASRLLTMRLDVLADSAANASSTTYYDRLLTRLRGLPGVADAALTACPPLNGGCALSMGGRADGPPVAVADRPIVGVHWVTPGWFSVARVRLVRGRDFSIGDRAGARRVVIVSASAAHRLWPGQDPIGRPVHVGQAGLENDQPPGWVVGVVSDVKYESLDAPAHSDFYVPFAQAPRADAVVFLRTVGDPNAMAKTAERVVRELDPNVPAFDVRTMDARAGDSTALARFAATLLTAFAAMALLLATLGIYSVIASSVALRIHEIGIRVALGATRSQVMRLAVRDGVVLAATGTVVGVGAALASTRVLRALLFGVAPSDPLTFVATVSLLAGTALAAAVIPARRAGRADPMAVLRDE